MKKIIILGCCFAVTLLTFTYAFSTEKLEIEEAYNNGLVSLAFSAKDKGIKLELKVNKNDTNPLILLIKKGETTFDGGQGKIGVISDIEKEIDLTEKKEGSIILKQSELQVGYTHINKGRITIRKNKH